MTDFRGKASKPVGTHVLTQGLANEILLRPACLLSERSQALGLVIGHSNIHSHRDGTEIGTYSPRTPWTVQRSCTEIDRTTRLRALVDQALWTPSRPPRSC